MPPAVATNELSEHEPLVETVYAQDLQPPKRQLPQPPALVPKTQPALNAVKKHCTSSQTPTVQTLTDCVATPRCFDNGVYGTPSIATGTSSEHPT